MAAFGDYLLYLATAFTVLSLVLYLMGWRGRRDLLSLARKTFLFATGSITLAIAALWYLILTHDFSVAYVFQYSSTELPLHYLFATLWGGQQGTFLLWVFLTSVMGVVMMRTAKGFEQGNMFFLNLFVLSLMAILIKKSPFELLPGVPAEGAGLNPLLQNFWMTIHPPIMFVGFAAVTLPFCYAMTGLVERRYRQWSQAARRWTLFAWVALGVALVMGGYWAYKTLGWGGFWAWDPVENSSFIPWIFLAAQVHTLFIKQQRKGLLRFSLVMVSLSFWSVLYGTFLTRSGVLADFSVHSFVDLGINQFLVVGMGMFILIGLSLLLWRWQDIRPEPSFSRVASRSYLVTLGVLVLFLGGILTLLGTSAPLLTRFTENPSNVGLSYYFNTMTPVAVAVLFLMALFPSFRWNQGLFRPVLLGSGAIVALLTMIILLLLDVTTSPLYLLLFGSVAWALVSNGVVLIQSIRTSDFQPAYLSHIGLAVALLGAATSAGFETKETITLQQGTPTTAMERTLTFTSIAETDLGFDCHVAVDDGASRFTARLPHEFYKNSESVMRKPHVEKSLMHDLYLAPLAFTPGEPDTRGEMVLLKEETRTIDKYSVTFHDFDMASHGEGGQTRASALLTIEYDGKSEDVEPALQVVTGDSVEAIPVSFDSDRGMVEIAGVRPQTGGVILNFSGDFLPPADFAVASLTVEVSEKPLIILFWIGTILVFISGSWSMRRRRRRLKQNGDRSTPTDKSTMTASSRPRIDELSGIAQASRSTDPRQ